MKKAFPRFYNYFETSEKLILFCQFERSPPEADEARNLVFEFEKKTRFLVIKRLGMTLMLNFSEVSFF